MNKQDSKTGVPQNYGWGCLIMIIIAAVLYFILG